MYQYLALTSLRDSHHSGPEPAILDWYGQCVDGQAMHSSYAPPEKLLKLGTLRLLLRSCSGQNATRISPFVVAAASEAF